MVEIVIQKVDPRVGPVRQLIEELDAYQNMLYPAESNYQLNLEEMSQPEALGLYRALGYQDCAAFGDYPSDDPFSIFMEKRLG